MKAIDKYIFACVLFFCILGNTNAQNAKQNRRRQKTESVVNDTTNKQTMTHTMPRTVANKPYIPKNPAIKFSNPNETLYVELEAFTNATKDDVKSVFSPIVIIKPFVRFYDRFDIGITTTQMIQNYTSDKMSAITRDMYAYAKLCTTDGDFILRTGKFAVLNYAGDFVKYMPMNNFFINALYMKSGHYYPRAIVAEFSNDALGMHIGYAEENSDGFTFTGNGAIMVASETFVEDWFKGGILITMGHEKTVIDIQAVCTPNARNAVLLEIMNIGQEIGIHGTYGYTCKRGNMSIFVNGFKQFKDGITGASFGVRHAKSGAYAAIGATYHDPMRKNDDVSNESYDKIAPFIECGIVRGFSK